MRLAFDSVNSGSQTASLRWVGLSQSFKGLHGIQSQEERKFLPKPFTCGIGLGFVLFVFISVFLGLGIGQNISFC